jgi:hypothetical protein
MNLIDYMAKSCYYAQAHTQDWEWADPSHQNDWDYLFQCTSYQIACFLAQNTMLGNAGVESSVILEELCNRELKTEKEWQILISNLVSEHGGLKAA